MPELPEVETVTNDLQHTVVGTAIVDFWTDSPKQVIPNVQTVKRAITGKKIVNVQRRAKLILLQIEKVYLGIHLKMTGRLLLRREGDPPDLYTRVIFFLQYFTKTKSLVNSRYSRKLQEMNSFKPPDNKFFELRFCDIRKFGYVKFFKNKEELERVVHKKLGPEPLTQEFTVAYLQKIFSSKNTNIKTAIMDQKLISGIGNIYANEVLYLAGIKPGRKAKSLTFKEFKSLRKSIQTVLKKGIKYRGSSAKDESYRDLFGNLGQYQNHFLVYEQKGKRCQKCQSVIEYQKLNGRGTFFCPKCQI